MPFFYNVKGDEMTIYIDGLLFLNFFFDYLLLLTVAITLRRNVKMFRIILGAFIGSLTILILFFKTTSLELFFLKIYLSLIMILVTFGYRDLKTFIINIITLYLVSILLGGFLYMINIEFSYKHKDILFINNGLSINVIVLLIISPIILYVYIKQIKLYKTKIINNYKTNIYINKKQLNLNGYLDTGNMLTYKNKPVILTNLTNNFNNKKIYIPYIVVGSSGLLECIKVNKVEVIGLGTYKNIYLGFSKDIKINGADILLNGLMKG